jgi:hypothetical protein
MTEKIEAFWGNATADDVARVMAGETVEVRFRGSEKDEWEVKAIAGWGNFNGRDGLSWAARGGLCYNYCCYRYCQVYREPSWYTDKPDPGPGFRLLGKMPDEPVADGDEFFKSGQWHATCRPAGDSQDRTGWYRRRIEQLLSGHRWLANGDRLESGDLYYEKGALLEVGHEYWGNKVVLTEAFMRKIEQPKSEPVEPKFAVGQTVKVVGPKQIPALEWSSVGMAQYAGTTQTIERVELLTNPPGTYYHLKGVVNWCFREDYLEPVEPVESKPVLIRRRVVEIGDEIKLPNGRVLTFNGEGFEVTQ